MIILPISLSKNFYIKVKITENFSTHFTAESILKIKVTKGAY